MKENMYGVTPSILYEIAQYAVEHPEKHFCADEYTDEDGDFLSCFFLEDDQDGYPIWELDSVDMKESEKKFLEDLKNAEANIHYPYEMEIDHCYNEDDPSLDGWYVYKYNEERGEAIPDDNDYNPIITDAKAERLGIDVIKCLQKYGCYYVA